MDGRARPWTHAPKRPRKDNASLVFEFIGTLTPTVHIIRRESTSVGARREGAVRWDYIVVSLRTSWPPARLPGLLLTTENQDFSSYLQGPLEGGFKNGLLTTLPAQSRPVEIFPGDASFKMLGAGRGGRTLRLHASGCCPNAAAEGRDPLHSGRACGGLGGTKAGGQAGGAGPTPRCHPAPKVCAPSAPPHPPPMPLPGTLTAAPPPPAPRALALPNPSGPPPHQAPQ